MSQKPKTEQARRIDKGRMQVILSSPFFGTLLMRMPMICDNTIETFCTNGRIIKYNEKFCSELSDTQLRGVLVHEIAHVAQGHLWRRDGREPKRWNHATDYAINNMMEDYRKECEALKIPVPWELPPDVLIDPQFNGLSSEEIYRKLPDMPPGGGGAGGGGSGPGAFEDPPQDPAGQDPDPATTEEGWKIAVSQAATVAKMQGKCPGSIRRLLDELINPKVPWRELLREFIQAKANDDYTFRKPARRYSGQGVILPGLQSERMGQVVVAVDTSGSVDGPLLKEFASEMQGILDSLKPEKMVVIYADADVQHVTEYEPGEAIRLDEAQGGGGTDFCPTFDYIDKMDEPPVAAVYLTDTYGTFPDKEPGYPVMWASYGGDSVPWGEFIKVE